MGADSRILTLTYQSDPSMSDKTPVGVEVYLVKGGLSTSRQGPAPLALGEIYGGDMGYAVQVTRITPEYAEIVVSDAGEPLTAPADLTTTAAGRSVQLTWIPPTGRTVLGVEIERRWRSGPETLYRFTADEITSWSDSSATVSSVGTYWYRVRLKTTQGYTPFTDFSAEVITADLPGPVTSAEVHPVDKGVVVRPQCTNGGAAITSHQVRYTHDLTLPVDQWETASVSADYDSAMKGLQNGQTYALQIACSNDAGTGPFSQTYYVTPSDPPQAPVVSRYMVDSDVGNPGYVRLWVWLRAAPGSEANSSRFRVWLDGEDYRACIRRRGDSEPCVINKLTPKQPYSLHLVSIDDARTWGPRETKIIKAVDPPTAPSNVRAEAGHGTASLSWSPSRANLADVITYEVRDESDRLLCDTTETQCSITLPEQGAWTVTITAFNDGVASPTTTFQGVVQGNPPPPDPPVSPPPPDPPVSPPPPDPPVSPPPTTQPPSTPPPTDPTGPPTPPPTGNPGSKPAEGPGAGSGHADPILGGGVPSTDTPSDIVRLQTIRKPRRTVRVGTTWKVPKRTLQGQRASWKSAKTSVCTVKKGKRLVFRKRGKCIVSVTAPSTLNLTELRKTFTVRVKSRR
jgi:hypothetical protein